MYRKDIGTPIPITTLEVTGEEKDEDYFQKLKVALDRVSSSRPLQPLKPLNNGLFNSVGSSLDDYNLKVAGASTRDTTDSPEVALAKALFKLSSETIIRSFLKHKGRSVRDPELKDILDYMMRKSSSILKKPPTDVDQDLQGENMDYLKGKLEELPGVKVTIIADQTPESATIILKLDTDKLDDEELETIPDLISSTINLCKPVDLQELEVIYHNKEVYR